MSARLHRPHSSAEAGQGGPSIDILRDSELWDAAGGVDAMVRRAVAASCAVGALEHLPEAELSVLLTDDAGIRRLNRSWRAKDTPTNVLSFPAATPERIAVSPILGDIILAYETIDREAVSQGASFEAHFTHLVVHGLLHLFGHDHQADAEAEAMERLETEILASLGVADPYADQPALRAAS